jgi:hypothetical protein
LRRSMLCRRTLNIGKRAEPGLHANVKRPPSSADRARPRMKWAEHKQAVDHYEQAPKAHVKRYCRKVVLRSSAEMRAVIGRAAHCHCTIDWEIGSGIRVEA